MHRIPVHLNALRAFEAAGRLSSFSRAAQELRVSHSTVSHHVRGLEKALGVALFARRDRSVVLTDTGATLLPVLTKSFRAIATALNDLQPAARTTALRVTVTPSIANQWLVPNLRRFRAKYPGIDVQLSSSLDLADFGRDRFDIGIRAGAGDWPGFNSELLMPIHMTPLCSPGLLADGADLNDLESLRHYTLIHADVAVGSPIESEWRAWLLAAGADDVDCSGGLSFHDPGLALQAAVDGLGIAMGYVELARRELATGKLVAPFESRIAHPWSYYIVTADDRPDSEQASVFREWLRTEAGDA